MAHAEERGLVWTRRWRGAMSGGVFQIRTVGIVQLRLLRVSNLCEHQTKVVYYLKLMVGLG